MEWVVKLETRNGWGEVETIDRETSPTVSLRAGRDRLCAVALSGVHLAGRHRTRVFGRC